MPFNHFFSAFSFIGFVLVSIPFYWHLEAWSTATCLYIFWVSVTNLTFFVNSVVWDGNVVNWAPVWCDISCRIVLATNIAIPSTCLCIQRRFHNIILNHSTSTEKGKFIIVDMMIGLGLPILNITLAYIVQMQRYEILEDFGCRIPLINTAFGVVLIPVLRLSVSLTSGIYGCVNVYRVWTKRRNVRSTLGSSACLNSSLYLRLFILSGIDLLVTIPFNIWILTTWLPVGPWQSWATIHADFSRVDTYSAVDWRGDHTLRLTIEGDRWISVVYAFFFFFFFGFTDKAVKHYTCALRFIAKKVGYITGPSGSPKNLLVDHLNSKPANSTRPHDVVLSLFPENQNLTAVECVLVGSSDDSERNGTTRPSSTSMHSDSKDETESESEFAPKLSDLKTPMSVAPRHRIPRILPHPIPLNLGVIRDGVQPPTLKITTSGFGV